MNLREKNIFTVSFLSLIFLYQSALANTDIPKWVDYKNDGWVTLCQPTNPTPTLRKTSSGIDIGTIHFEHKKWVHSFVIRARGENLRMVGKQANLSQADLSGIIHPAHDCWAGANLAEANFEEGGIIHAIFDGANMRFVNMKSANLTNSFFRHATFGPGRIRDSDKKFLRADLTNTTLVMADFTGADLRDVNFKGANLSEAVFTGADLTNADLNGADLNNLTIIGTILELPFDWKPDIRMVARWRGLESVMYKEFPHTLTYLRSEFKRAGLRDEERALTYAIEKSKEKILLESSSSFENFEGTFRKVFFGWTCAYGMAIGRPWLIIIFITLLGSFGYTFLVIRQDGRRHSRIYASGIKADIGHKPVSKEFETDPSSDNSTRLVDTSYFFPQKLKFRLFGTILGGLWFSLLSSFTIGWRDLNVGQWLSRLQPREFYMWSTGWVRFWSTLQSIFCVYLLALWALIYFGRPFE